MLSPGSSEFAFIFTLLALLNLSRDYCPFSPCLAWGSAHASTPKVPGFPAPPSPRLPGAAPALLWGLASLGRRSGSGETPLCARAPPSVPFAPKGPARTSGQTVSSSSCCDNTRAWCRGDMNVYRCSPGGRKSRVRRRRGGFWRGGCPGTEAPPRCVPRRRRAGVLPGAPRTAPAAAWGLLPRHLVTAQRPPTPPPDTITLGGGFPTCILGDIRLLAVARWRRVRLGGWSSRAVAVPSLPLTVASRVAFCAHLWKRRACVSGHSRGCSTRGLRSVRDVPCACPRRLQVFY